MALVPAATLVGPACAAGRGVGAFNVIGIEHAEAILTGAEAAGAAVVLQISENCVRLPRIAGADRGRAAGVRRAAAVPVAVHLDHATSRTWSARQSGSVSAR